MPSASARVMAGLDVLFTRAALVSPRNEPYDPAQRIDEASRFVESLGPDFGADADAFFPELGREGWTSRVVRRLPGGSVVDLRTASDHTTIFQEEAAAFRAMTKSRHARARHFRHQSRHRTAIILIHGFMAGDLLLEEHEWPTHAFYDAGLDVVLAVLPGHGPRKGNRPWEAPEWPAKTPTFTIEGYRKAIGELRGLVTHLLADGVTHVGVVGMSLGGYTSALLSTVESRLSLVAPFIPLASTADFLRENGQIQGTAAQVEKQYEILEAMFASVSPMTRPCLVPREGRMVFGGAHDRVTPLSHADRIASHFRVDTTVFPGAHILQYGRSQAWHAILRNLRTRHLMPKPHRTGARR